MREVVGHRARQIRADQHPDTVRRERDEALRRASKLRARMVVGIDLAGGQFIIDHLSRIAVMEPIRDRQSAYRRHLMIGV
nr:hypothetical protein [Burkholderia territorii]